jgi:Dolichyl-phosphate-mannose-protein mannosyltransferase
MKNKILSRPFYLLLAILTTAAVLRLNHINQPFVDAFGWRQISNAMMADNFYRVNGNIFYPEISWNGPGPSYNGRELQTITYLATLLYRVFGQQDWVGRSLAVIFGLWGIFALYQLVRRVWDEEHALIAAAVMTFLPASIFIERSFLPDPVMVALVTTSFWMLVAYFQTERLRYLLFALLIGTWGFLTKLPGLLVGIPMLYSMFAILGHKKVIQAKFFVPILSAATLTLIPVIVYYLWARHLSLSYPPYHFAGGGNWVWDDGISNWLSKGYFLEKLSQRFQHWLWGTPIILLVFLGLLLRPPVSNSTKGNLKDDSPQKSIEMGKAPWIFHWWLLSGVVFYFIGAEELVDNPWNFHIFSPAAAAIAGHAILTLAQWLKYLSRDVASTKLLFPNSIKIVTSIIMLLVIATSAHYCMKTMYRPYGAQSHELGLALKEISQPGELVVTIANIVGDPVAIYYSQRRGWVFPPADNDINWGQLPEDDRDSIRMFENLRTQGADWFGVVSQHQEQLEEKHTDFWEHIGKTCQLQAQDEDWSIYRILSPSQVPAVSQG